MNSSNGQRNEFTYANMKCSLAIENGEMRICLPWNAVHIPVQCCHMCGRKLSGTENRISTELGESLARLSKSIECFTKEMEEYRRTALDVAKHVVNTCIKIGHPISNVCLQFVLYELYKAALRRGEELFYEEFCASPSGPRLQMVYDEFCVWGALPITMEQKESDNPKKQIPEKFQDLFNVIICATAEVKLYDWLQIVNQETSAWLKTYDAKNKNALIRQKDILAEIESAKDTFAEMLNSAYEDGMLQADFCLKQNN